MNMKKQRMVLLVILVMTGAALSAAVAWGQQDRAPTSAVQKPPILAPGDSVSDRTQLDAAPTARETAADELTQGLLALKGIVGVGNGQCDGSPCIRVYLENDSPDLRSTVPRRFRGFEVVTEVTGPIEALPAVEAQAVQRSSGSRVELDVFSGVPNPMWVLSLPKASELTSRISRLAPPEAVGQRPDDLGYRGFIVQIADGSSATAQTIGAYHGIVEVTDSTGTAYYRDPQRQIELWLLATAQPSLDDRLTAEIVEEIVKDAPLTRSADQAGTIPP
jgi:hypothetical protein